MRPTKSNLILVVMVLAAALAGVRLWAQTATGRVVGNVSDAQGALVVGAAVIVTNADTGVAETTTTNKDGYFEVPNLPIGNYMTTVSHASFNTATTEARKLEINESLRFNITLSVGTASQSVNVNAQAAPGVETINPTIGDSVTGKAIQELPLNGRNVLDLMGLQAGVTEANPDSSGGSYSVSGGRTDATTYLLDGGLNSDLLTNTVVLNPNPDAIAEFRVLTSNYTAEYGRNAGGIVSVVTKSGTNHFHGSAFDFVRNDAFNANTFFNNREDLPRNILKRHQFGGTFGGPISIPSIFSGKDRLFFFAAYQGQRQTAAVAETQIATFTPTELAGDFSHAANGAPDPAVAAFLQSSTGAIFQPNPALAAEGIINPSSINPVATKMIAAGLIPTSPTGVYNSSQSGKDNRDELTGKVDYVITPHDHLSVTVGGNHVDQLLPYGDGQATVPGYNNTTEDKQYFASIDYTRTIGTNMLNEARATAQRSSIVQDTPAESLPGPTQLGIKIVPDLSSGPPTVNFDSGLAIGFNQNGPTTFPDTTYSYTDTFSWYHGNHGLKFGAGFSAYQDNLRYSYASNGGFYFGSTEPASIGNQFADFLIGNPYSFVQGPSAPNNIRTKGTYLFAQDEWRVIPQLVITTGLRYEYNTPKLDTLGRTDGILPGVQSTRFAAAPRGLVFPGDKGAPKGLYFPDENNFAPRFGFAWSPSASQQTSLRGGFGVFYDVINGHDNIDQNGAAPFASYSNPSYGSVADFTKASPLENPYGAAGIPNPFPTPTPKELTNWIEQLGPFNATTDDPHVRTPYVYQYSLSLQQAVKSNMTATVSYVGSNSKKLIAGKLLNAMILGTTNRIFNQSQRNPVIAAACAGVDPSNEECPFTGGVNVYTNGSNASYNGLQTSLTKQLSDSRVGQTFFTLAYTWSHSIDNASGRANRSTTVPVYQPGVFRASSDFDVQNTISFSGGWQLPFDHMWTGAPSQLTKGWGLYPIVSWRTGFPLNVNANYPSTGDNDPGSSGAGDPSLTNALYGEGYSHVTPEQIGVKNTQYFNTASFSNAQYTSLLDDPVNGVACGEQNIAHEFASRDCVLSTPSLRTYGGPRNAFRGPGHTNVNVSLAKDTHIFENLNAQLRLEAFNVFNHTEFSQIDTGIGSSTFGQAITTYDPRILQVALRLSF
jgi:Carboxypeptidase regulatory-like domain/TonB-dependent Receptor Plug Domain/TonB dependent receptor